MKLRDHLPIVEAPESVWRGIEEAIDRGSGKAACSRLWWGWAIAAAAVVMVGVGTWWFSMHRGGWIETNASTGKKLQISDIGSVDMGPNTRLRIVSDLPGQHRLSLAHGFIHAKITAPPRIFSVDTKSGTAVDLGCEYAMQMDEDGSGDLRVSAGWVEFEWKGTETLVPAGALCKIRPVRGPELPYFEDSSLEFEHAIGRNDVASILRLARARDTLTLWHLLSRVESNKREVVYDRIASLISLPATVSKGPVLALDPAALNQLKEELAWKW